MHVVMCRASLRCMLLCAEQAYGACCYVQSKLTVHVVMCRASLRCMLLCAEQAYGACCYVQSKLTVHVVMCRASLRCMLLCAEQAYGACCYVQSKLTVHVVMCRASLRCMLLCAEQAYGACCYVQSKLTVHVVMCRASLRCMLLCAEQAYGACCYVQSKLTVHVVMCRASLRCMLLCAEQAYGACCYVRWRMNDGTLQSNLIVAKNMIAPVKMLTVVRLELSAAVMAARLYEFVIKEYRFKFTKVYFIIDSEIVLSMIQKDSYVFRTFVGSRVGEIQTTDTAWWFWIEGSANIANWVTKPRLPEEIGENSCWQKGPEFLERPEE